MHCSGLKNFFNSKVPKSHHGPRFIYISQVSAGEFVAGRPGSEHSLASLMLLKKMAGGNVQLHKIFVGQIILRGEFVGRIEKQGQDKTDDDQSGRPLPTA